MAKIVSGATYARRTIGAPAGVTDRTARNPVGSGLYAAVMGQQQPVSAAPNPSTITTQGKVASDTKTANPNNATMTPDQINQAVLGAMGHRSAYLNGGAAASGANNPAAWNGGTPNWKQQEAANNGQLNGGFMRFAQSGGVGNIPSQADLLMGMNNTPNVGGLKTFQAGSGGIGNAGTANIARLLGYTVPGGGAPAAYNVPTSGGLYSGSGVSSGTPGLTYGVGSGGGVGGVGGVGGAGAGGTGTVYGSDLASQLQKQFDQANADNLARYNEGKGNITSGQAAQNQTFQQGYQGLYGLAGQISDAQLQRVQRANQQDLASARSRFYGMGLANTTGAIMAEEGVRDISAQREADAADQGIKAQLALQQQYVNQQNADARANRNELNQWIYNRQDNGPDMALWSNILARPGAVGGYGGYGGGIGTNAGLGSNYGGVSGIDPRTGQRVNAVSAGGATTIMRTPGSNNSLYGNSSALQGFNDPIGFLGRPAQESSQSMNNFPAQAPYSGSFNYSPGGVSTGDTYGGTIYPTVDNLAPTFDTPSDYYGNWQSPGGTAGGPINVDEFAKQLAGGAKVSSVGGGRYTISTPYLIQNDPDIVKLPVGAAVTTTSGATYYKWSDGHFYANPEGY